jgi:hypothetical protein
MRRRTFEKIAKYTIFGGGALAFIAYTALSLFKPSGGLERVVSREAFRDGVPTQTLSKFEKNATKYSAGMFYQSDNTDFSEASRPKEFFPSKRYQFEFDAKKGRSIYVARTGQKQENPIMKAGTRYTVQFSCPATMKSISVTYNGMACDARLFMSEGTNCMIAKAEFVPITGSAQLKAQVDYMGGERDVFDIPVRGQ